MTSVRRLGALLLCALVLVLSPRLGAQPATAAPAPGSSAQALVPTASDPSWGDASAPVTLVLFQDLRCPHCGNAFATLQELKGIYGPRKLRIAYKHFPLAMHAEARPAAETAAAVHRLHGTAGFERYVSEAHAAFGRGQDTAAALKAAGLSGEAVQRLVAGGAPKSKVDEDVALAAALGVQATPSTYVNGLLVQGALPIERFQEIIDGQLAEADKLRDHGAPAAAVSGELTRKNFGVAAPAKAPAPPPAGAAADPTTVYRVPVEGSPALGPATAAVTLVVFSDFQCPHCSKLDGTIGALRAKYGDQLRVVFKQSPLPSHKRAEPAAELALEAFARKGDAGFWAAHDRLFAQQRALEDPELEKLAAELGLDPRSTMKAVRDKRHAARIADDLDLAEDVGATGTPASYVNGRKLAGARPASDFEPIIDEELAHAQRLLGAGVPPNRLYAEMQKGARGPVLPPKAKVPAPSPKTPIRGARNAPVTIQVFADFQCPYSLRLSETLAQLRQELGPKVRVAWRQLPLSPIHPHAREAANAAAEAFAQQGNDAFWKMHDALFARQRGLDRDAIHAEGQALGLDLARLDAAMAGDAHAAAIDADLALANALGVTGTPTMFVNGYRLDGAQPSAKIARLVRRALKESRRQ